MNWLITQSNNLYLPLRYWMANQPSLFYSACQLLGRDKNAMTQPDTEIVIEGFPRSANTFSVVAFKHAQKRDVKIAHHLHAQAQIIRGVHFNLPVCVLIRNPIDTVKSLQVAFPNISSQAALKAYIKFYYNIYALKNYYIVARFEEVITDFGGIIHKINQKFGTQFREFLHTENAVSEVWEYIKIHSNTVPFSQQKRHIQIPTKSKDMLKNELKISENIKLVEKANEIHKKLIL